MLLPFQGVEMMDAWIYPQGVALGWVLSPLQGVSLTLNF
jgi:hypothetical protein